MSINNLDDLGWGLHPRPADPPKGPSPLRPARVMYQGRDVWRTHDGQRESVARLRSRSDELDPVTGDWVSIDSADPSNVFIISVLPRRTEIARVAPGGGSGRQVIAANVDIVALCTPADDPNPRRLERELTAVWESGATPLCLLTKSDLVSDPAAVVAEMSRVTLGVDILMVTVEAPGGTEAMAERVRHGLTVALIGASGVGKTSLVNALTGDSARATSPVRSDGKGRHTTTTRQLVAIPTGGLLLDTPGMREFAPWADESTLAESFPDIEELGATCRFRDCGHTAEPGCAVLTAAAGSESVAERLRSWRVLQRELAWLARRSDARLMAAERRRWAQITRAGRDRVRP